MTGKIVNLFIVLLSMLWAKGKYSLSGKTYLVETKENHRTASTAQNDYNLGDWANKPINESIWDTINEMRTKENEYTKKKPTTEEERGSDTDPITSWIERGCMAANNKKCIFPFIVDGITHEACIKTKRRPSFWCSTKTDESNRHIKGSWGVCLAGCPVKRNIEPVPSRSRQLIPLDAQMSSIWRNVGRTYPAKNCIDGDNKSICLAGKDKFPWLAINIAQSFVSKVIIINRGGPLAKRAKNLEVWISDQVPTTSKDRFTSGEMLGSFPGPAKRGEIIHIVGRDNVKGSFVVIQTEPEDKLLNLAEVLVYGQPDATTTTDTTTTATTDAISGGLQHEKAERPTCKCGEKKCKPLCGRVVGGRETQANEYPWIAIFNERIGDEWKMAACSSTLIASRWAVTAAHCVQDQNTGNAIYSTNNLRIVLGVHKRLAQTEQTRKIVKLSKIIVHPNFNGKTYRNDIALLKFSEPVDLDVFSPACLPRQGEDWTGRVAWVYGWGRTYSKKKEDHDRLATKLQHLKVNIVSNSVCKRANAGANFNPITSEMMCTGGEKGKDSCLGDSGGPVTVDHRGRHVLVGAVSHGHMMRCALEGYYGVNADISHFRNWIDSTIKKEDPNSEFCR